MASIALVSLWGGLEGGGALKARPRRRGFAASQLFCFATVPSLFLQPGLSCQNGRAKPRRGGSFEETVV